MKETYVKGMEDALRLWGDVCGAGRCDSCPLGLLGGANMTCQEVAAKSPEKMLSILQELKNDGLSYYQEYCLRFPESTLTIEEAAACLCRKALFEGYLDCERTDEEGACVACWSERYMSDTEEQGSDYAEELSFL